MKKYIEGVGEVVAPKGFKEHVANFWYHYKLHSILSLILIFAIIICSLQFCQKEEYDIHVMYAGGYVVGKTAKDGEEAEVVKILSSLKRVTSDYNSDGTIRVNFTNYFYMSAEEMQAAGSDIDYAFLSNDKKSLEGSLQHSEYYLCFISPAVYEAYNDNGEIDMFMSLTDFKDLTDEDAFYTDNAIKLSETDFYKMPGISSLPEDTLICIRTPGVLASKSKEHTDYLSRARSSIEKILNYSQNVVN